MTSDLSTKTRPPPKLESMKNPLAPLLAATCLSAALTSKAESPESLLKTPLIVGASVSAGHNGVMSPGKNLAIKYTPADQIRTLAANGRTGRDSLRRLTEKDLQGRSLVIGVDLFFWDTARSTPAESLPAVRRMVELSQKLDVPLVLGDIPALFPPFQPHLQALNQEIHAACKKSARCAILPLHGIHQKAQADGYILYRGKRYPPHELLPDGLHLSALASDFLADQISSVLAKTNYFR